MMFWRPFYLEKKEMQKKLKDGDKYNLNEQDFTDLVAFATSPAGELFFAGVFDGAIPLIQYAGEEATVVFGKLTGEEDESFQLAESMKIEPKRLLAVHQVTNYSPRDVLRGLWFELKQLHPHALFKIKVPKSVVTKRFDLGADAPDTLS